MDCRAGCGACCTAPSISSPIPGMPGGNPPGSAASARRRQPLPPLRNAGTAGDLPPAPARRRDVRDDDGGGARLSGEARTSDGAHQCVVGAYAYLYGLEMCRLNSEMHMIRTEMCISKTFVHTTVFGMCISEAFVHTTGPVVCISATVVHIPGTVVCIPSVRAHDRNPLAHSCFLPAHYGGRQNPLAKPGDLMHTNVDIDEELIAEAMQRSGLSTKRAVVEAGLRALLLLHTQAEVRDLRGRLHWQGDEESLPAARTAAAATAPAAEAAGEEGAERCASSLTPRSGSTT